MKGFTLIEILVVTAIISIVAAIIYPVFAKAKQSGNRAVAISNLRQCSISLNIYLDDNSHYPALDVARTVVPHGVTSDPGDYWRKSRDEVWPLLLGSFGYAGEDIPMIDLITKSGANGPAPLLVSIFYSDPKISSFKGDSPPSDATSQGLSVGMPSKVLTLRTDGSVKFEAVPHLIETPGWHQGFTWGSMFYALAYGKSVQ
jgi:prepilin-type N-terminal cleavage/methylation domain-containing protein